MAELQMRLLGQPGEVLTVVEALKKELSEDPPILRDVSPVYPTRGPSGDVRVYLKLDGARLTDELTFP